MPKINETFTAEATIRPDRAYSIATAARALTVCTDTLRDRIKSGAVRAIPVGKRKKAVPGAEILRILAGESFSTNPEERQST